MDGFEKIAGDINIQELKRDTLSGLVTTTERIRLKATGVDASNLRDSPGVMGPCY